MLTPKDEEFLQELRQKRELTAARLAKLNPHAKEYAWEKEQLDDFDKGIRILRAKAEGFIHPDAAAQPPRFPDEDV